MIKLQDLLHEITRFIFIIFFLSKTTLKDEKIHSKITEKKIKINSFKIIKE